MEQSFLVSDRQLMHQHWNKHQGCKNWTKPTNSHLKLPAWPGLLSWRWYAHNLQESPIHKFSREDQLWWSSWITTQTWRQLFLLLTGEICQKLRLKLKIWKFCPGLVSRGFQGQKSENNNNKSRRITMFGFQYLGKNIKEWSNICTWYLVDSQISQNLLKDDCNFYYIFQCMICPFGWKNPLLKGPFPSAGGQGNKHPSTSTSLVLENLPYTPTIWASFSLYHIQPGFYFLFFSIFIFSKIWHIFQKNSNLQ